MTNNYKKFNYIAKKPDQSGNISYTTEENAVWQELIHRQSKIIENRACPEYIHGLQLLNLPKDRVPQCSEVSSVLQKTTGWNLEPVEAIISFDKFFELLANRRFPAATFIRRREELDYLKEPDIFHEVFGHCPLLTNKAYAEFTELYGKLGLKANHQERMLLARVFWFTIEFGLIKTTTGLKAYGGGILSSINETVYCLESDIPVRKPFDLIEALHTSYQIDVLQPVYFVLNDFEQLYNLINTDIMSLIHKEKDSVIQTPKHPC